MHADRPAGLEADVEERVIAHRRHLEPCHRLARRQRVERVPRAIPAVTADPPDPSRRRLRLARTSAEYVRSSSRGVSSWSSSYASSSGRRPTGRMCRDRAGGRSRGGHRRHRPRPRGRAALDERARARQPAGWTTRPAGLSTMSRCSSSHRRDVELFRLQVRRVGDLDVDRPHLEPEALPAAPRRRVPRPSQ
jgi:hypothetical protein